MSSSVAAQLAFDAVEDKKVELRPHWSEDDLQRVFRVAYEQVFGRQGIYASEKFASAESLLRNGKINVRQFIQALAKSDFYKECFFLSNSQGRFIELNYKHLLGRAPYDQSEIAEHVDLYATQGYDAEIDSYINSAEYDSAFGDYIVPYYRGFQSLPGVKTVGYNRMFALYRGMGNSDNAQFGRRNSRLRTQVARNSTNWITPPSSPGGMIFTTTSAGTLGTSAVRGDHRMFMIEAIAGGIGSRVPVRRSIRTYSVPFDRLSTTFQEIHKSGGKIVKVSSV
jgi:phycoerythrocyanin-associated rod linker protein